ncbi:glycosyltransferase [Prosthecomicrobium hirschii]|uniref:glycosyltransferase n=1 Tax=Prosthecodimorpha hirschii TaxID=665126 RepID=UPI000B0CB7DA|nr:glycosyltransferase [Prosthecomicrobium hirschii]
MSKIGIGIITFKRLEYLKRVVDAVREFTTSEYELVVAEDGGEDGAVEWCRQNAIRVVTGPNAGACWNRNRALFALQELGCDPVLFLEDDCLPVSKNWDWQWRIATALFGHVSFAHPKLDAWRISGTGTPTDPIANHKATSQCLATSGLALAEVGFLDTRFKGYGVGHAEWTNRMKRAGYGFKRCLDTLGRMGSANLYIHGGLVADDGPTFRNKDTVERNQKLYEEIKREPIYRNPWSNEDERSRFLAEQAAAGIGSTRHQALLGHEEERQSLLGDHHLGSYDRAYRRAFGEPKSFLRSSGWLSSIALAIPAYDGEIIPWFNYTFVDLLRERVRPDWDVFEFGAGYSTLWWSKHVTSVHSVEHDEHWADLIRALCPPEKSAIESRPADSTYSEAILNSGEKRYDIIVVDGFDRPACISRSMQYLKPDGSMIVDNSNRQEYREAIDAVKAQGFRELSLKGPAPMTHQVETTSLLYRADNSFGL